MNKNKAAVKIQRKYRNTKKRNASAKVIQKAYRKHTNKWVNRLVNEPIRKNMYVEWVAPGAKNSHKYVPTTFLRLIASKNPRFKGLSYNAMINYAKNNPNNSFEDPYTRLRVKFKNVRFVEKNIPVFARFRRIIMALAKNKKFKEEMTFLGQFMFDWPNISKDDLYFYTTQLLGIDFYDEDYDTVKQIGRAIYKTTMNTASTFMKGHLNLSGGERLKHDIEYVKIFSEAMKTTGILIFLNGIVNME